MHTPIRKGAAQRVPRALPPETFSSTPLAEHTNCNNRAASTKNRNERNCPDGIAEQCRSDSHAHSHDEHDCGWNDGNQPVHGAPKGLIVRATMGLGPASS